MIRCLYGRRYHYHRRAPAPVVAETWPPMHRPPEGVRFQVANRAVFVRADITEERWFTEFASFPDAVANAFRELAGKLDHLSADVPDPGPTVEALIWAEKTRWGNATAETP